MDVVRGTVFLVDDTREVRTALSRVLTAEGYLVHAFESAERYLEEQDEELPGCLLLDICLPGLSGMELQRALDGSRCSRPIVFLTGMGDIETSVSAMKAGAIDFLMKPIHNGKLLAAVKQALECDAAQRSERAVRDSIEQRLKRLTPREQQVMAHVVRGRLNKQIAAEVGTREKTVKVHRGRVMSKMGVRSVPELVQLATRVGGLAIEPSAGAAILDWDQT